MTHEKIEQVYNYRLSSIALHVFSFFFAMLPKRDS